MAPSDAKQKIKEAILNGMEKMGDVDTQKAAVSELEHIITASDLTGESARTLVTHLCTTSTVPKVFVRKESLRLLAMLAGPSCQGKQHMLQPTVLVKVVAYAKSLFKDQDSSVRTAVGDMLGALAHGLADIHSDAATADMERNQLLRAIFEALADAKKETQAAAAHALAQVVPALQGPLPAPQLKLLLKYLNGSFFAKAALIGVFASCTGSGATPAGLVASNSDSLLPLLPALVGQSASSTSTSSGLIAALFSSDWSTRKAAADAIKALVLGLGTLLDYPHSAEVPAEDRLRQSWRAAQALNKSRHDKLKPVRDSVMQALVVLADLQDYLQMGLGAGSWQTFIAARLQSRGVMDGTTGSPLRHSPHSTPPTSATRNSSALRRMQSSNSVHERFRKAAAAGDVVAEAIENTWQLEDGGHLRKTDGGPIGTLIGANQQPEVPDMHDHRMPLATLQPANAPIGEEASTSVNKPVSRRLSRRSTADAAAAVPAPVDVEVLAAQHRQLQEQHQRLVQLMENLATSTQQTVASLEARVASLEAALARSAGACTRELPSTVQPAANPLVTPQPAGCPPVVAGSTTRPASAAAGRYTTPSMQRTNSTGQKGSSATRPASAAAALRPAPVVMPPAAGPGGPDAATPSAGALTPLPPDLDIGSLYEEALSAPAGSGELQLLRLMVRTGPAWASLSPATGRTMLDRLLLLLGERRAVTLARILPWFWPLADEDAGAAAVAPAQRAALVAALAAVPAAEDAELGGKVSLLLSTLRAVWGLAATGQPGAGKRRSNSKRSSQDVVGTPGLRSSIDLSDMRVELDGMQSRFAQSAEA